MYLYYIQYDEYYENSILQSNCNDGLLIKEMKYLQEKLEQYII